MPTVSWALKQTPFKARAWLLFLRRWFSGWSIGILTSILANVLTVDSALGKEWVTSLWATAERILIIRPPLFYLSAAAITALILAYPVEYGLSIYCRKRQWDSDLSKLSKERTGSSIAPFAMATISWGENLTLQLCPDISKGWSIQEAKIAIAQGNYQVGSDYKAEYERFLTVNVREDFVRNNNRVYGLALNPTSFTDSRKVTLLVKQCWYAETRFTNEVISRDAGRKSAAIKAIATDLNSTIPNKLAAHIVVVTDDDKFLATLGSKKKGYASVHGTWSYSIEEGINKDDLEKVRPELRVLHWIRRALAEELAVGEEDCPEDGIKLLAVFLEGHNLNFGVVAIVRLNLDSNALSGRLKAVPRPDTEMLEFKFLCIDDAIRMLAAPSEMLHPTSEYRLFLALCHLLTSQQVARRMQSMPRYIGVRITAI